MTEQLDDFDLDDMAPARPDPTGVPRVDAVLDALTTVGDRPVDEQVAVFEQAHAELRSTLDDPDPDPDVDADAPPA